MFTCLPSVFHLYAGCMCCAIAMVLKIMQVKPMSGGFTNSSHNCLHKYKVKNIPPLNSKNYN